MGLIWFVAWGNYMTRVADAFQIPLETENAFARVDDPESAKPTPSNNSKQ
jgi:hypothetical protein